MRSKSITHEIFPKNFQFKKILKPVRIYELPNSFQYSKEIAIRPIGIRFIYCLTGIVALRKLQQFIKI